MATPEEARGETLRLHNATRTSRVDWPQTWSDSELMEKDAQPNAPWGRRVHEVPAINEGTNVVTGPRVTVVQNLPEPEPAQVEAQPALENPPAPSVMEGELQLPPFEVIETPPQ
jgi:hypothetical protein